MLFSGGYLAPIGHVLLVSVIRPETAPGKAPKVAKAVAQGLRVRPRRERYWAVAAGAAAGRRGPARRGHSGGEGGGACWAARAAASPDGGVTVRRDGAPWGQGASSPRVLGSWGHGHGIRLCAFGRKVRATSINGFRSCALVASMG